MNVWWTYLSIAVSVLGVREVVIGLDRDFDDFLQRVLRFRKGLVHSLGNSIVFFLELPELRFLSAS